MNKVTFKQFLLEVDASDLELQKQVQRQKDLRRQRTQTRDEFQQRMAQSGGGIRKGDRVYEPNTGRMYPVVKVTDQGVFFKGNSQPTRGQYVDTGKKTELGHRIFQLKH